MTTDGATDRDGSVLVPDAKLAGMQVVTGTASESRLLEIMEAEKVQLSRQEWYRLYLAAGHILP